MSNPFDLFGLQPAYAIDLKALDKAYFELQRAHHPDKQPASNQNRPFDALSSDVNTAYQALKNPVKRAAALLEMIGMPVPGADGSSVTHEVALLDILDFQETIMMCETSAQAKEIKEDLDEVFGEEQNLFSEHYDRGDLDALPEIYVKLSYIDKLKKQIDEIEREFYNRTPIMH